MIEINKQGNAIRIDFTDNDKYLFNGTMEVAPNELMLVVDESDMITFKRTTNGDVLFSQKVNNIKIAGSAVTKDNVIQQFATIGYSQSGGGGGASAVTSVNGQTGDVVLTATSLGAITKADADTLYAAKSDLNSKADKTSVYTKAEADEKFATDIELNQVLSEYATNVELNHVKSDLANKANSADVYTKTEIDNMIGDIGTRLDQINGEVI